MNARSRQGPPWIGPAWLQRWWFGSDAGQNDAGATVRVERLLLLAFGLVKAAALVELSAAAGLAWTSFRYGPAVALVIGASALESAAVIEVGRRRGRVGGIGVLVLDTGMVLAGLLVALLALQPSANPYLDNVYYPYSVASMALAGLALRRLPGVIAVPTLVASVYAAATVLRFSFRTALLMNMATYWVFPLVGWALARTVRWLAGQLDAAREREVELVRERESALHAEKRLRERTETFTQLHNHVLQDLEFLAREHVLDDERLRQRVAADAAWLRALLADRASSPGNLTTALAEVALHQEENGLRVELNTAGIADMTDGLLAPEAVRALADAVYEALTNVREHAGVGRAFVHAELEDETVIVTVVDRGCGFDTGQVTSGYGLRKVIGDRVSQVGGRVTVTSRIGDGTRVELRLPVSPPRPGASDGPSLEPGT